MNNSLPPIYFFYPKDAWHEDMPMVADKYWYYHVENQVTFGMYSSIIQTYLHLKESGFPCELVTKIPSEGIVVAHRRSFPFHLRPNPKQLFICYKANYDFHPYAQIHVVLNSREPKSLYTHYYIPHWRQTGLIPRDPARGDRFENVAYFGLFWNLAPELRTEHWQNQLKDLGLSWRIVDPEQWNDYRDTDAVVAVRNFKRKDFTHKPALKLYNAWHAHVPAILGEETSFQAERQNELDYIEITSPEQALQALKRLRDNPELRRAMVENGKIRAEATTPAQLVQEWQNFFKDTAVPAYQRWQSASQLSRKTFYLRRYVVLRLRELQERGSKQLLDEWLHRKSKAVN
ncbi:hypothetical protein H6F95_04020 [Cyanobacteria bacterium FACHB-471]|nr:hypothetical protein [Cyanobacteria bacterium FACHB-471]